MKDNTANFITSRTALACLALAAGLLLANAGMYGAVKVNDLRITELEQQLRRQQDAIESTRRALRARILIPNLQQCGSLRALRAIQHLEPFPVQARQLRQVGGLGARRANQTL
jgi:uncharacterized protein HemX